MIIKTGPTYCAKCCCVLTSTYIYPDRSKLLVSYAQVKANSKLSYIKCCLSGQ